MCYSMVRVLCQRPISKWALLLCDTMHKAFCVRRGEIGIVPFKFEHTSLTVSFA